MRELAQGSHLPKERVDQIIGDLESVMNSNRKTA